MASFLKQLGTRIGDCRELKKYTVTEVARLCGVYPGTIRLIEKGSHMPPYSLYEDICRTIGTTMEDILHGFRWTYTEPKQEGEKRIA